VLNEADIPLPDEAGRKQLFAINLRGVKLDATVDIDELAKRAEGYSGSDITSVGSL
jgi:ATP-dependent 26S proteasome regulatory subunit